MTINPSTGNNLKPEDGSVTVQISVEAPHSSIPEEYLGEIKIVNDDNDDDYCIISASLITPNKKDSIDSEPLELLKRIIYCPQLLEKVNFIISMYLDNSIK